jgi:hypothetical protein
MEALRDPEPAVATPRPLDDREADSDDVIMAATRLSAPRTPPSSPANDRPSPSLDSKLLPSSSPPPPFADPAVPRSPVLPLPVAARVPSALLGRAREALVAPAAVAGLLYRLARAGAAGAGTLRGTGGPTCLPVW